MADPSAEFFYSIGYVSTHHKVAFNFLNIKESCHPEDLKVESSKLFCITKRVIVFVDFQTDDSCCMH